MKSMHETMLELLRPNGRYVQLNGPDSWQVERVISGAGLTELWDEMRLQATNDEMHIDRFLEAVKAYSGSVAEAVELV